LIFSATILTYDMIQAQHAAWADRIFHPYVTWLFKRHFHVVRLLGKIPETNPELPLLLLPNHSTWWDGFFVCISGFLIELAGVNTGATFAAIFTETLCSQLCGMCPSPSLCLVGHDHQPGGDFTAPAPAALFTPAAADGGDGWKLDDGLRFILIQTRGGS
jgi:hypothetical protein